jgi:hypothetical protein
MFDLRKLYDAPSKTFSTWVVEGTLRDSQRTAKKPIACAGMIRALIAPAGILLLAGCSTTDKDYAGPALPDASLAIVEVGQTQLFEWSLPLGVAKIDGVDHAGGWSADQIVPLANQEYRLLPGMHTFELQGPAGKGILGSANSAQSFQVTALLEAGKRYRIIGRREPMTGKGFMVSFLTGIRPVHVELLNETDGNTVQYNWEVPITQGDGMQSIAAFPTIAPAPPPSASMPPAVSVAPPAAMRYADWAKQNSGD